MKIYTKTGDSGETSLVDGQRIGKDNLRLEAYGTSDELNSFIGLLRHEIQSHFEVAKYEPTLESIQNNLFVIGGQLACADPDMSKKLPFLGQDCVESLEKSIDRWDQNLPALKNFILPGGTKAASLAHVSRTITRRLERACVRIHNNTPLKDPLALSYINRLSDGFFVLSRALNFDKDVESPIWKT